MDNFVAHFKFPIFAECASNWYFWDLEDSVESLHRRQELSYQSYRMIKEMLEETKKYYDWLDDSVET